MYALYRPLVYLFAAALVSTPFAGYFLSWPQKGELLVTGAVTDTSGNRYDVRIVPGYLSLVNFGGRSWSDGWRMEIKGGVRFYLGLAQIPLSLENLSDYVSVKPWRGMGNGFRQAVDGEKYLFTEFMWSGVGSTWAEYMGNAHHAQERQSFGWWFAYPWATIKGTVNTALRYMFGVTGAAGVAAYGIAIRPAWELSYPLLKVAGKTAMGTAHATYGVLESSWGLGVNQLVLGVAAPVSGYVWTTGVGIPMVLAGRAPTPKSADGWWVEMIRRVPESYVASYPDSAALEALVRWQGAKKIVRDRDLAAWMEDSTRLAPLDSLANEAYRTYRRLSDSLNTMTDTLRQRRWLTRDSLNHLLIDPAEKTLPQSPENAEWNDENKGRLEEKVNDFLKSSFNDSLPENEKEAMIEAIVSYWMHYGRRAYSPEYGKSSKFDPNRLIQDETKKIIEDR